MGDLQVPVLRLHLRRAQGLLQGIYGSKHKQIIRNLKNIIFLATALGRDRGGPIPLKLGKGITADGLILMEYNVKTYNIFS